MQRTICVASQRVSRAVLAAVLVIAANGCAGAGLVSQPPNVALNLPAAPAVIKGSDAGLARVRTELVFAPVPDEVAPELWQQLTSALYESLESHETARESSVLPDPVQARVSDLQFVDDGAGGFNMLWSYTNPGDYDSNGEVNTSDITPIAQNFRLTDIDAGWDAGRAADGDANGEVNIADVAPIGMNFFAQAYGYRIYGGDTDSGPWTLIDSVALAAATSDYPRQFNYALGLSPYAWILLTPYDAQGADWVTGGGGGGTPVEIFNDFNTATTGINDATKDYTDAYNELAGANLSTLSVEQLDQLSSNFVSKGQAWVAAAETFNTGVAAVADAARGTSRAGAQCPDATDLIPDVPGTISSDTIQKVADLQNSNLDKIAALKQQYPNYGNPLHPDHDAYKTATVALLNQVAIDGTGTVLGAFVRAGTGVAAGLAVTATGVLGGGIIVAGVVGAGAGWLGGQIFDAFWTSATSTSQDHHHTSAETVGAIYSMRFENGASFPAPADGTLWITTPGYAPLMIQNFHAIPAGQQLNLNLTMVEADTPNAYSLVGMQCTMEPAVSTCENVAGVTCSVSPPDPAPGQTVTVTATLMPAVAGCGISYTVAGTDGYAKAQTLTTDASGQISFTIPGGAAGVRDSVQLTADGNGLKTHIVYVF